MDGGEGDTAVPYRPDDDLLDLLENGLTDRSQYFPIQRNAQRFLSHLAGQDTAMVSCLGETDFPSLCQGKQLPLLLRVQSRPGQAGLLAEVGGDGPVDVVAAQAVVPCNGDNFYHVFKAVHHTHIQRTAAEIHDQQPLFLPVRGVAVVESRRRGLVNEPLYWQPRQLSRQPGGTALVVIEVGGDADDGFLDLLSQGLPSTLGQLPENQGGQLMGKKGLSAQQKFLLGTHPCLERGRGFPGMGDKPLLCHSAHGDGTVLQHAHAAGRQELSPLVGQQLCPSISVYANQRVGGPQVNSNDCHRSPASFPSITQRFTV